MNFAWQNLSAIDFVRILEGGSPFAELCLLLGGQNMKVVANKKPSALFGVLRQALNGDFGYTYRRMRVNDKSSISNFQKTFETENKFDLILYRKLRNEFEDNTQTSI